MLSDGRMKKILAQIIEAIKTEYFPEKIVLYGSYIYGQPDKNSDIDLLIIKKTSERPIDRRVKIRRIVNIRDSSYPAFSPIVLTPEEVKHRLRIGDQIMEEILAKGKVLYAR